VEGTSGALVDAPRADEALPVTEPIPVVAHAGVRLWAGRITVASGVLVWGLLQNVWRLGAGNWASDEKLYAEVGWEYVHGRVTRNMEHPPLAKYLIGAFEVVFGHSAGGARAAAVAATLGTALVLWRWAWREAGWWCGVLAGGMWLLLPHRADGLGQRLDRYAMLDPFVACAAVLALYCGWRWSRGGRWPWVLATGVAAAMACTAKANGVMVVPVIAIGVLLSRRSWRTVGQLAVGGLAAAATAAVVYLPVRDPVGAVRYLLRFQSRHSANGHRVLVRGVLYPHHPPWWADLWFTRSAFGGALAGALAVAVLAAVVLRRDALVTWLAAGAGSFLFFQSLVSGVTLPHYVLAWLPELTLLAALGGHELVRPGRLRGPRTFLAGALAPTLIGAALLTSTQLARTAPHGLARLDALLDRYGVSRPVLVTGFAGYDVGNEVAHPVTRRHQDLPRIGAIVVRHDPAVYWPPDRLVLRYLAQHAGQFRRIPLDEADVYLPTPPPR
jgi:4-amino-4-deoxy-L-arabinose transferase-like glycosyltransferase